MKRFVLTAVMLAAVGSSAFAQQPVQAPAPIPVPYPAVVPGLSFTPPVVPVPVPHPDPVPPFPTYSGPPGPPIPIDKSGGRITGLDGYYTYDTGLYLLAGTAVSRQAGYFTMVFPNGNGPNDAPATPAGHKGLCFKHGIFRR